MLARPGVRPGGSTQKVALRLARAATARSASLGSSKPAAFWGRPPSQTAGPARAPAAASAVRRRTAFALPWGVAE